MKNQQLDDNCVAAYFILDSLTKFWGKFYAKTYYLSPCDLLSFFFLKCKHVTC